MADNLTISYEQAPYDVRQDIVETHQETWEHIASPGTWLTGVQRVAIAAETRNAAGCALCRDRKEALSPYAVKGEHESLANLPDDIIEMIHRIVTDPGRITQSWVDGLIAGGINEPEYVEIVGVISHTMCVDGFSDTLGMPRHALPEPVNGEPTRILPSGSEKDTAWLPTIPPENAEETLLAIYPQNVGDAPNAPHVRRAMSLVPNEAISFFKLNDAQYLPPEAMWNVEVNPRSITKSQVELTASRVSSLNGCFY
jgi:hypothetical protein